jgi:uncharacterized membrane protein
MKKREEKQRVGLWLLICFSLIASVFLRFYRIGKEGFWFDEVYAAKIASFGFGEIISGKIADPGNPPLFFAILSLWAKHFGFKEGNLRSLSAVISVLTLPLICLLAKAIYRKNFFVISSVLIFSTSLFPIIWGQQARSYSLFLFLVSFSLWLQSLIIFNPKIKNENKILAGYFLVSLAGLYTHYLYFYVLFLQIVSWGIFFLPRKDRKKISHLLLGFLLTFGVFLFFWGRSNLLPAIFSPIKGYDIEKRVGYPLPALNQPRFSLKDFYFFTFNGLPYVLFPGSERALSIILSLFFVLPLVLLFFLNKKGREILLFLNFPILITIFLAVFTPFGIFVNQYKYFIFLIPYITLLWGYLFSLIRIKEKVLILGIFLLMNFLSAFCYLSRPHLPQYKEAAKYLLGKTNENNRVYSSWDISFVLEHYFQEWQGELFTTPDPFGNKTKFIVKSPDQNISGLSPQNFKKIQFYQIEIYEKNKPL